MPINNFGLPNKFKPGEVLSGWSYISKLVFDHEAQIITATYKSYADKNSAYSGGEPIDKFTFSILPVAQSGVPSYAEIMGANLQLFGGVAAAVDTVAMSFPVFASGTLETPVPPSGV